MWGKDSTIILHVVFIKSSSHTFQQWLLESHACSSGSWRVLKPWDSVLCDGNLDCMERQLFGFVWIWVIYVTFQFSSFSYFDLRWSGVSQEFWTRSLLYPVIISFSATRCSFLDAIDACSFAWTATQHSEAVPGGLCTDTSGFSKAAAECRNRILE